MVFMSQKFIKLEWQYGSLELGKWKGNSATGLNSADLLLKSLERSMETGLQVPSNLASAMLFRWIKALFTHLGHSTSLPRLFINYVIMANTCFPSWSLEFQYSCEQLHRQSVSTRLAPNKSPGFRILKQTSLTRNTVHVLQCWRNHVLFSPSLWEGECWKPTFGFLHILPEMSFVPCWSCCVSHLF